MFPRPGMMDPTMDPANVAQTQGLFQQAKTPPWQGGQMGQPRIFGSVQQAQVLGHQPLDDSIAQTLFTSRQLTPEGMKIEHATPAGAAAVNTHAQAGLAQSVNPVHALIGQQAPGLPSPQEIAMRKQLFQL
jgi:hypothetical protein